MGPGEVYSKIKTKIIYKCREAGYKKALKKYANKSFNYKTQEEGWIKLATEISGDYDSRYVPENVFHLDIKPRFNDMHFASVMSDKAYLDLYLQGKARTADTVLRQINGNYLDKNYNMITAAEAEKIYNSHEKLFAKPTIFSGAGRGVKLVDTKEESLVKLNTAFAEDYICQIPVKQSKQMSILNESSINSIKINTVMLGGEVKVMSSFVRVGAKGSFADNQGTERYFIGITKDGRFKDYCIKYGIKRCDKIPSGYDFAGKEVPSFEKAKELVKTAHRYFPRFGMCFWDVCIDENEEPVIIELNLQNPAACYAQAACGYSFFGDYAEEIFKLL